VTAPPIYKGSCNVEDQAVPSGRREGGCSFSGDAPILG